MFLDENDSFEYLEQVGVLPRFAEILEQLAKVDPLPADPLMYVLRAISCPLIPQSQMKALERKLARSLDELRYLRRLLINLGGQDQLYDNDDSEDKYVGSVGGVLLFAQPPFESSVYQSSDFQKINTEAETNATELENKVEDNIEMVQLEPVPPKIELEYKVEASVFVQHPKAEVNCALHVDDEGEELLLPTKCSYIEEEPCCSRDLQQLKQC